MESRDSDGRERAVSGPEPEDRVGERDRDGERQRQRGLRQNRYCHSLRSFYGSAAERDLCDRKVDTQPLYSAESSSDCRLQTYAFF